MVDITQSELQELVGENAGGVCETEEGVVGEDGAKAHSSCVEDGFMAETTQTGVTVNDLDLLSDDNVAEDREEGEDRGKGALSVDNEKRDMVDLQAVREIAYPCPPFVRVCDDDDLVSAIDQLRRQLVDVAFDAARLREEEVTDHGDVVGHLVLGLLQGKPLRISHTHIMLVSALVTIEGQ